MFKTQSLTITGLIVIFIGFILKELGISIISQDLTTTITTIIVIIGGIASYIGRKRQGDITWYGKKIIKKV